MNCFKHYDRVAANRCNECGQYMCEECSVSINNVPYCKDCVAKMAKAQSNTVYGGGQNEQIPPMPKEARPPRPVKRSGGKNAFFLFCLSCIPGLNYMYLGLMKRGMFFMMMFFMITFVTTYLEAPMLGFLIFIELCYSFFDGFKLLGFMRDGYAVEDNVDDVMEIYTKHKRPIIVFSIVAVALSVIHNLTRMFDRSMRMVVGGSYGHLTDLFSLALGVIIILLGCFIVAKGIKKNNDEK